jgi:hypothetical protein
LINVLEGDATANQASSADFYELTLQFLENLRSLGSANGSNLVRIMEHAASKSGLTDEVSSSTGVRLASA